MTRSIFISSIVSVVALSAAFTASAEVREPTQLAISTTKVDLNNAHHARVFYNRLQDAAEKVCTSPVAHGEKTIEADIACARQAVSDAVREINAPQLSALDGQAGHHASAYAMTGGQH
ncbi:MAG TPA: UrcA family protein [Asticcacaulis sp.]|nr:UrcA family protein [Asticcacaulis sp.]